MKKDNSEIKKAQAEVKKAKLSAKMEAKSAKAEAKKAKAEKKSEKKKAQAEAKKTKSAAKSEAKKAKAEAKKANQAAKKAKASAKKAENAAKKAGDEKKPKFSKKIFIPILAIVFLAFASIGYLLAVRTGGDGGGGKPSEPVVAEEYAIGGNSVISMPAYLEKKVKLKEIIEPEDGGPQQLKYVYKKTAIKHEEALQYGDYLVNDLNYVSMGSKDEDPLIYVIEGAEEGQMFQIRMETDEKNYVVTVSLEEGTVPRPEEKKKEVTRDDAYSKLSAFVEDQEGMAENWESYEEIFDIGQAFVGDELCYGVNVYKKGESAANEIVAKYFVSLESDNIYEYNLETGEYQLVNGVLKGE